MPRDIIEGYEKIVPDAYHGTSAERANHILRDGFTKSDGERTFLGDGVYFYEGSSWAAWEWARNRAKGGHLEPPLAVLRATINLGRCLDLNNKEHREVLQAAAMQLSMSGYKNVKDSTVINFICTEIDKHIDTIRATYTNIERGLIFSTSRFYGFSEIIICVVNIENIHHITPVTEA